jgi:hypothetical protein
VAGRPAKSLLEHVRDGSFRPNRHHELLAGDRLRWKSLQRLQDAYRDAASDEERLRIARDFEREIPRLHERRSRAGGGDLEPVLAKLGPPGSAERTIALFPRFFRHHQGPLAGRRFTLAPFQQDILRRFLARDKRGRRVYRWLLYGVGRGNGKTPMTAGLGLEPVLSYDDGPEVYAIAGSKDQAAIGLEFASRWTEESELAEWLKPRAWKIERPETKGYLQVLSSDGRLGHGRRPRRFLVDEWWAFETAREEQAYIAGASALHKFDVADLIAISTAGYDKTSQLGIEYEQMLQAPEVEVLENGCLTIASDRASQKLMVWYGAPENVALERDAILAGEHDDLLRACNPLTTLSLDAIRAQFALLPFEEACRLILNQWTKAKDVWISAGVWSRLRADVQIPAGADIWVAVDAAKNRDTTACVWGAWIDDRRVGMRARVWSADPQKPHHVFVPGGRIRNSLVEGFIVDELAREFRVREVVFDPRYFDTQAENLADHGLDVTEFPQNSPQMADAWTHWHEAVEVEGTVAHDADPVFAEHVTSASAVWTERGWKVFKTKQSRPIDALVAAAMMRERASRGRPLEIQPWAMSW